MSIRAYRIIEIAYDDSETFNITQAPDELHSLLDPSTRGLNGEN